MFLDTLRRRNPAFLDDVAALHATGALPPNCLAVDLDTVAVNTAALRAEADRLGLSAFAMTKQMGRNPDLCRTVAGAGIPQAVGVDLACAQAAAAGGLHTGHIGHLVQIPRHAADAAAALTPSYWTVFDLVHAADAAAAAARTGREQPLLARIVADGDRFYPGHEGGFPAEDVVKVARELDALDGARFAGITTFPAALFDADAAAVVPTPNLATLTRARAALEAAGFTNVQVNAPGTTSAAMLAMLAEAGATQVEPGHGLTGTTPWHAVTDLVERPAAAYVSEVSHLYGAQAFVYGGGLYVDPVLGEAATRALIVPAGVAASDVEPVEVDMPAPAAIDYYARIPLADPARVATGDTVVFGFRAQAFVTRCLTAGIRGVGTGRPQVAGVWAADGSAPLVWPPAGAASDGGAGVEGSDAGRGAPSDAEAGR